MMEATTHLLFLNIQYDAALTDAGVPKANADQILGLGNIMAQEYGKDNVYFRVRARQMDPTTGLTAFDDKVLQQAAPLLTPAQLTVLAQSFSGRNRKLTNSNHS